VLLHFIINKTAHAPIHVVYAYHASFVCCCANFLLDCNPSIVKFCVRLCCFVAYWKPLKCNNSSYNCVQQMGMRTSCRLFCQRSNYNIRPCQEFQLTRSTKCMRFLCNIISLLWLLRNRLVCEFKTMHSVIEYAEFCILRGF